MTVDQHSRIPIAQPHVDVREKQAVMSVLDSGQLAGGKEVAAFESEFAAYCDGEYGVATSNGTTALHAALEALGIGEGDTVVTTPFTFIATANAVRFTGAEPVFADIDPDTYNLDPEAVEAIIRDRNGDVDAILAVHLYGLPADLDGLLDVADMHDVPLIEDAAQAHGATYRGKPVGSIGDAGCFSFYPTKNMTTGEGGMIVTDDRDVADRARQFIDHGRGEGGYEHPTIGHNFRMTDIAAAIGRVQLERLPKYLEGRQNNARRLLEGLSETNLTLPIEPEHVEHAYHQFTVRCDERDDLVATLEEFGIDVGIYYPTPVHRQPAYSDVSASLPEAERAAEEVLSLPVHPQLSANELETIVTAVSHFDAE